jgi:hypothetical protein
LVIFAIARIISTMTTKRCRSTRNWARLRLIKQCVEIVRDHGLEVGTDGDNLQVDEELFKRSIARIRGRRAAET